MAKAKKETTETVAAAYDAGDNDMGEDWAVGYNTNPKVQAEFRKSLSERVREQKERVNEEAS